MLYTFMKGKYTYLLRRISHKCFMTDYSHYEFTPPINLIINRLQKYVAHYRHVVCYFGMHINPKYIQI